ncbi:MAG: hypothetical protein J6L72_07075 [Butyricicoccus sp.]|nr:hypothetical protein [Butyricicoccus sp.]
MKYNMFSKDNTIYFAPVMPKRTRVKNDGHIRLTDEAFEVLDRINALTGVPLTQLASEMIKFAGERCCVLETGEEEFA